MPTFSELLAQLSFLAATPSAIGVLVTAGLLIIFLDWRLSVLSLACQAIFAGLLYSQLLPPQLVGIKVVVGLLISLQMFVTARQTKRPFIEVGPTRSIVPTGLPFRVIAAAMVGVIAWQASSLPELSLPNVSSEVALATFGLLGLGLLGLGLTEDPLKAGMFLITTLTGFELYYASVEPALAVIGLLAATDFAVALGACYLAAVHSLPERSEAG
jgi:hypothetical protein